MALKTVGKLDDWSKADVGTSDFMQLEEGSNAVRMVTSPYQFYTHWTKDATGQNRKVRCAIENCPLCQKGENAQARWYVVVLNRKTGKPAILELGMQIFKQVLGLKKKDKWGDPRGYDIDIERQPKGSQPLYVVSPEPKEPLTQEEKNLVKEFVAQVDLDKMVSAPTPDEVREKLGMDEPKPAKAPSKVDSSFEEVTPTTEDDDFNFDA